MNNSFKPNKKRVKQRRKAVMEAAYRAKSLSEEELTNEVSNFIKFAFSLQKAKVYNKTKEEKSERSNI